MTTPPPPPGGGSNQPYDPSGSGSAPAGGPSGAPTYGSAPGGGMPPQAPPPAPGGAPQGGSDQTKILSFVSMGTGIVGVLLCCCWGLPIFSVVALITGLIAKNQTKTNPRPDLKTYILIGIITGAIGLAIAVIYWILVAAGVIDINAYSDMS
ncbi:MULTISPECIES: DUF4190 domain-containing protein [Janibacter]|uniref:DUF4190 domain-containing protein n=2 Tax=Janibacter hoylei PVAS-1 TaxID=1210046 RepID=A0A444B9F5_9MICO|nr:DUF4190 domain-containing protein [Janibacter hoylei]MCT1619015.1 DUF4190 domain-containing protein [Janibacter hoylei]MCT2291939.1 DUF4190 domain-containing protein [Janibacter hoylei]MCW4602786.1 DUF4190 domain-containing protein [Janibacter hoylei]RWU85045.1 hypothetical protein CWN80_02505 [Janibacter hoylei PVAS-1]